MHFQLWHADDIITSYSCLLSHRTAGVAPPEVLPGLNQRATIKVGQGLQGLPIVITAQA